MCTRLCFTSCGVVNSITHAGMPIVSCAVSSSGSPSNFFFVDWLYIVQTPKHTNHSLVILISFLSFFAFLSFFIRFLFFLLCRTEASTPPVYYILHSGSRVSPLQWYKCPYSHFKIHLPLTVDIIIPDDDMCMQPFSFSLLSDVQCNACNMMLSCI